MLAEGGGTKQGREGPLKTGDNGNCPSSDKCQLHKVVSALYGENVFMRANQEYFLKSKLLDRCNSFKIKEPSFQGRPVFYCKNLIW